MLTALMFLASLGLALGAEAKCNPKKDATCCKDLKSKPRQCELWTAVVAHGADHRTLDPRFDHTWVKGDLVFGEEMLEKIAALPVKPHHTFKGTDKLSPGDIVSFYRICRRSYLRRRNP